MGATGALAHTPPPPPNREVQGVELPPKNWCQYPSYVTQLLSFDAATWKWQLVGKYVVVSGTQTR